MAEWRDRAYNWSARLVADDANEVLSVAAAADRAT